MDRSPSFGPYQAVSKIGSGGAGTVYLAHDPRLGRQVAIKLLHPLFTDRQSAVERFRREALTASQLNHPNICTIFDIGEQDGAPFLVMEYLEGETLRDRLRSAETPPSYLEFHRTARQLADALACAHAAGALHRDIKPENVFITRSGLVKLLDFGLAKSLDVTSSEETITKTGTLVGTLHYMSPEHILGQETDARSDLFSLGTLLYELATHVRPFAGSNAYGVMGSVLRHEPGPLHELRADIPEAVCASIHRLLEKEPEERFPSAQHFHQLLLDLHAGSEFQDSTTSNLSLSAIDMPLPRMQSPGLASIAVLPFVHLGANDAEDYFGEGLAEELINALNRIDGLRVAARSSSFRFRQQGLDIRHIGKQLGVRTVLEGSIRKAGNRIRILARLVEATTGYQLWSETFDRELEDIFSIQDETARAIVDKLEVSLSSTSATDSFRLVPRQTEKKDAYKLYLKGRFYWNRRQQGELARARDCFEAAVALDPDYALAHVGIADVKWSLMAYYAQAPQPLADEARASVERALELQPHLPEALATSGTLHTLARDWKKAARDYRRAILGSPRLSFARTYYCMLLGLTRRSEELREQVHAALELEPLSQFTFGIASLAHSLDQNTDAAEEYADQGLDVDSSSFLCLWAKGVTRMRRDSADGFQYLQRAVEISKRSPFSVALLGVAHARMGPHAQALELRSELARRGSGQEYVDPILLGWIDLEIGRQDAARTAFEDGISRGVSPFIFAILGYPFPDLVETLGLSTQPVSS